MYLVNFPLVSEKVERGFSATNAYLEWEKESFTVDLWGDYFEFFGAQ